MTLSDVQRNEEVLLEKIWNITFCKKIELNTSWKTQGDVFICEKKQIKKKNITGYNYNWKI